MLDSCDTSFTVYLDFYCTSRRVGGSFELYEIVRIRIRLRLTPNAWRSGSTLNSKYRKCMECSPHIRAAGEGDQ
jgi:hypothetical protein